MSYDIHFVHADTGKVVVLEAPYHGRGGTYAVGGTEDAWLNITYNYGWFYYRCLDSEKGIRSLYGLTGAQCIPILEAAIEQLGIHRYDKDYWAPTPGNAGAALQDLLDLARLCPDAICQGD